MQVRDRQDPGPAPGDRPQQALLRRERSGRDKAVRRILALVLLAAILAGISLALLVEANFQVKSEALHSLATEEMILVRQAARGIQDFFDAQKRLLLLAAQSPHVIRMDKEGERLLAKLLAASPETLWSASRMDPDGRILYSFPHSQAIGQDISSQEHVAQILAEHRPVVSDVFTTVQGYDSIALHVPVFDGPAFAGTLGVLIPFEAISRHYLETLKVAQSGYAFVVSKAGIELFCPVPGHTGRSIFDNCRDFPEILAMARRMLRGEEGEASFLFDRVRGARLGQVRKRAVFTPVPLGNTVWSICVATPEPEVLAGITGFRNTWLLMLAVLGVSCLIISYLLARAVLNAKGERLRRQAEAELARHHAEMAESRAKLAMVVEMAGMGHWEMDVATNTFTFNDQFYALYGTTAEREGGMTMPAEVYARRFMHPDEAALVAGEVVRVLAGEYDGRPAEIEHRIVRRDGQIRHIVVRYAVLRDPAGRRIKTIGANQDITERKWTEEALFRAKEAAEAANRSKSEFLATMSHEIRTPLNGVLGMLQLALTTDLAPEQREYVATAISSGRSLLRVLSDILDISRIEAGALHIVSEDFLLRDVFEPIAQAFADESRAKGLRFACVVDPRLPPVLHGDAGRIRQVAYNLVGNALKYTETGEVRLAAYPLSVGDYPGVIRLHLEVSDTGIGVPADKLATIFDQFTQVDGSFTRRHGGAGLGLAIVKRLVGLMGGELSFCSEPGVGTDVHVGLPLRLAANPLPPRETPLPAAPPQGSRPLRVLLAEDDPVNLLAVSHLLAKSGHQVHSAGNGAKALRLLQEQEMDCVLMDIQMPGMDGLEATRRIRAGEAGDAARSLPIIALTAHAMKGDREQFLAAGMDGYLAKPVDLQELERPLAACARRDA